MGNPIVRHGRLQEVRFHAYVLESRGLEHSARAPMEVFCAKDRARQGMPLNKRAAHYAWKHALPQSWARICGKNSWRTVSEDASRVNAAAWHW